MPLFQIKHRCNGSILFELEIGSMRLCIEAAIKASANLRYADLQSADLRYADLRYANLQSADLQSADLRYADLRYANLQSANLRYADLQSADLRYANLQSADLQSANLQSADLHDDTRLPTGETFGEYKAEVLPALLTAGGKKLNTFVKPWECHKWENCPMHHAFKAEDLAGVPILLRPRAEQFIQLFDAKLLPCPVQPKAKKSKKAE